MERKPYIIGYFDNQAATEGYGGFYLFNCNEFDNMVNHISFAQQRDCDDCYLFPTYYRFNLEQITDYAYFDRTGVITPSWSCNIHEQLPLREDDISDIYIIEAPLVFADLSDYKVRRNLIDELLKTIDGAMRAEHYTVGFSTGKVSTSVENINLTSGLHNL